MDENSSNRGPSRHRDLRQLDEICDQFETVWQSDARPNIHEYLPMIPDSGREELLCELLVLELDFRLDHGETPSSEEYLAEFPEYESAVHEAFQRTPPRGTTARDTRKGSDTGLQPKNAAVESGSSGATHREQVDAVPGREASGSRRFGDYELVAEIARGGMGIVYRARQLKLNRTVAVKTILAGHLASQELVDRFLAEAEAAAQLQHAGIVAIHEVGQIDGQHFFSMDLVEGISLAEVIREKPLSGRQAAGYIKLIAEAIHYAHLRGVLHRDLKPSNVLIDAADQPRVTDFGLAKLVDSDSDLTASGQVLGTPSYMPPEQARGEVSHVDARSDVYALGAMLYALLTGRPPFQAVTMAGTLHQVLENDPIAPRQLNPEIDRDLETICLKCLEKDAGRRYGSAEQLARELARYLAGEPILARPIGRAAKMWRWCKRNPALASACGLAVLLLLAVAGVSMAFGVQQRQSADRLQQEKEQIQRLLTEKADLVANLQQEKQKTDEALIEAKRLAATALMDLGLNRCRQGEIRTGVMWLVRALEETPAEADDLDRVIRANLASWTQQLCTQHLSLEYSPPQHSIETITYSPDGKLFATGAGQTRLGDRPAEGSVQIWDAATYQTIGKPLMHASTVLDIVFSPKGREIVTRTKDGTVRVWDVAKGTPKGDPLANAGAVRAMAFNADGRSLLTADYQSVRQWDIASGKPGRVLLTLDNPRECVMAFSPDARVVAAEASKEVRLWNVNTGMLIGAPLRCEASSRKLAFSTNGKRLATAGVNVQVWELATGDPVGERIVIPGNVQSILLTDDGATLITGSDDCRARVWDVHTGELIGEPYGFSPYWVRGLARSPNGRTILTGGKNSLTFSGGTLKAWNAVRPQGKVVYLPRHSFRFAAIGPDKKVLLYGGRTDGVREWDHASGELVDKPENKIWQMLRSVGFLKDGTPFLLKHDGVFHAFTSNLVGSMPAGRHVVAVSRDGSVVLARAGQTKPEERATLQLWDTSTGAAVGKPVTLADREGVATFRDAVIGSDNKTVLMGGEVRADVLRRGIAKVFDMMTGEQIGQTLRQMGFVTCVALSEDGRIALTGGKYGRSKGEARVWNARTGEPAGPPMPHENSVKSVALSVDGTLALIGCWDGTARLWDVATSRPVGPPLPHLTPVWSTRFAPDGQSFLTASTDAARVAPTPRCPDEDIGRIALWAQVLTGREIDANGVIGELDEDTRIQRRDKLEKLGGPPAFDTSF